ncbi:M48 family metalloprotease [Granulicella cerasi]|uniref:M48 family metalloprotease n=1 Tax=Granulicella cerasi TaxID=741063 RepID=A0ABW1ZCL2_9BACT
MGAHALPRRWWLAFAICAVPVTLFLVFADPYINFAFNQYEPMTLHHAALAQQLEQVAQRGHMDIPLDRMFVMKASAKVTTMNADVEGFGASKRVVVWDTTIDRMKPEEVVTVFGHESGHYVLNHVRNGVAMGLAGLFVGMWLAAFIVRWMLARFGAAWRIPRLQDWGTFAVLFFVFSLFGLFIEPLANTMSRHVEHDADVYGQEAVHGLVADPQAAMQGAMVRLGENSFAVPNEPLWEETLLGNHPALGRRAAFAHAYDPWAAGMRPKYFPR